jgi:hypothetical protein
VLSSSTVLAALMACLDCRCVSKRKTLLENVLLLQHVVTDNNLVDDVSELMHSTLLENVLLLQHVVTDNNLVDDVS